MSISIQKDNGRWKQKTTFHTNANAKPTIVTSLLMRKNGLFPTQLDISRREIVLENGF